MAMYKNLSLQALGYSGGFDQTCALAQKHNFAGVELDLQFLHQRTSDRTSGLGSQQDVVDWFTATNLLPAGFPLRAAWRETDDEATFVESLETVTADAKLSAALGCTRCFTTVPPSSPTLDFYQDFDLVVPRLISVANILASHGIMLGFEFLGAPSLRSPEHKDFVHTLDGARTFAAAIGMHSLNTGVSIDSSQWHATGGAVQEIAHLDHHEVVYVHVNDAVEIDTDGFLGALRSIGYEGPVTLRPTVAPAIEQTPEEAVVAATKALNRLLG
jgi:sugar phosphate isomerase/epimerase